MSLVAGDLAVRWAVASGVGIPETAAFATYISEEVRDERLDFEVIVYTREFQEWVARGRPMLV
jgi:hypothetical protein